MSHLARQYHGRICGRRCAVSYGLWHLHTHRPSAAYTMSIYGPNEPSLEESSASSTITLHSLPYLLPFTADWFCLSAILQSTFTFSSIRQIHHIHHYLQSQRTGSAQQPYYNPYLILQHTNTCSIPWLHTATHVYAFSLINSVSPTRPRLPRNYIIRSIVPQ